MKQTTHTLNEFAKSHSITKRNLKTFCKLAYHIETEGNYSCCWKRPPKLRIIYLPIKSNGSVRYIFAKKHRQFTVLINLYHLSRRKNLSEQMTYAFLYATVVHELEHIRLLHRLEQQTTPHYFEVISAWDQVARRRDIRTDAIAGFFTPSKRKLSDKRTAASPAEIYCNLKAFERVYDVLKENLTEEDQKILLQMIDSLTFISKNLEISYSKRGRAVGLFAKVIKQMGAFSKHIKHMPMLACLLNKEGQLISPAEMMNKSQLPEQGFYDDVLIRIFIFVDGDWDKQFEQKAGLKEHICVLANAYCQQSIQYLLNQEKLKVFMPDDVIQDNTAMLVKSVHIVKKKMKQYGMKNTAGGFFPMYGI